MDVILSNCVINLSTQKEQVFREAFRVLKPVGRLALSDMPSRAELPEALINEKALYAGCMTGAVTGGKIEAILKDLGFQKIRVRFKDQVENHIQDHDLSPTIWTVS